MTQGASTSKRKKRSSSQRVNLEEERESTSNANANQISLSGIDATSSSTKSKRRLISTRTGVTKREEGSLHSRKQKGKVGHTLATKELSLPKGAHHRRKFNVQQEDDGSSIDSFEKKDQLITTIIQGPNRKRTREATSNAGSHLKTLMKPRKSTKSKNRLRPKLTNIREENSLPRAPKQNLVDGVHSTAIPENEKDRSELQHEEIIHYTPLSLQNVKTKAKKRSANLGRTFEKMQTRKISLKEKSRAGKHRNATKKLDTHELNSCRPEKKHLLIGSHALHSLRKSTSSREVNNTLSKKAPKDETLEVETQDKDITNSNCIKGIDSNYVKERIESKETIKALKVASVTSGFVRASLKAVENSKSTRLKIKEGTSPKKNEDVNVDKKPNKIAELVAERYKTTLEALQSKKALTAEKLIEELEQIPLPSKGNTSKARKLGKRHIGRSMRTNFKKDMKDESIGRDSEKENCQPHVTNDGNLDAKHIKLGRKTKKSIGNEMIDKPAQNQGVSAIVATKKSKSPVISGFHRLVSGAGGNKEFESALAQIVSSHDGDLGWTKEQEKALQDAYLSIQQTDGDFWHLISKEVPGRSAKECYNKFYSRHPTPSPKALEPASKCLNEREFASSFSSETSAKANSLKVLKKQKQLEAQKTIQNILRHVDDMEGYEINNSDVENNHHQTKQDVESNLDRMEDENAVILQSNHSKNYNSIASHLKTTSTHASNKKGFFEAIVISGASSVSDKENNQPHNHGQELNNKKLGVPRVELTLKQAAHGEHFPYDGRPKTTTNTRKKKIIRSSNVYLHSRDALDFGDSTLDAIQRAKEELKNVFSKTNNKGGSFFDIEAIQIGE